MISGSVAVVCAALTAGIAQCESATHTCDAGVTRVAADEPMIVTLPSPTGLPGSPIDLNLKAPTTGLRFVIFRKIAPEMTFSRGFRMNNSWIVGIADLDKLQFQVPSSFEGTIALEVTFHRAQGQAAARGQMAVSVTRGANPQNPSDQVVGTAFKQDRQVPNMPRQLALSSKEEDEELERGQKLVKVGDIATARLIFQNLVLRGSATAARFLAETYDPQFLRRVKIAGLQPDLDTARKWYTIASDAGDSEASIRLNVLAQQ